MVILGDSMTKLLNGWEMAKRIRSNCKIDMKTFSGATVSSMKDYMKPSLRYPREHFISSAKSSIKNHPIDNTSGMSTLKRNA